MDSESLPQQKQRLRCELLQRRREIPPAMALAWGRQLTEYFWAWPIYQQSATILFYVSLADEAPTEQLIADALRQGKRVCVPLLNKTPGEMSATQINSLDDLTVGKYGLKMPRPDQAKIVSPSELDLIVVPAVAFDRIGNRLGMGAGYYDRFLPETSGAVFLGLAWTCQIVAIVQSETHDIRMDYVLSENGFIDCHRSAP